MARYPLTVLYDGACPLCSREMAFMKHLDRKRRLRFCDFSTPDYDAAAIGIPVSELSTVIHAQWEDGTVITGGRGISRDLAGCRPEAAHPN